MASSVLYIINGRVVTPIRLIGCGGVRIEDGVITHVFSGNGPMDDLGESDAQVIDARGRYISPGFVDIHLHGGGGADLMDGMVESLVTMCRIHASGGSTAIVPSTLTSSDSDLIRALEAFRAAVGAKPIGSRLLGVHLEGPYFSQEQRGAQDPRYIRNPSRDHYMGILERYPEVIRVSAAPELEGALDLGRTLRSRSVLASVGHTDASFEQVVEAVEAGYSHVTHLYSGMAGVRRVRARRVAGAIEAGLALDELTVEVIADGVHLPASLLKLIVKCKGPDRTALITDAIRAAGMTEGEYIMGSADDGQKIIVDEGVAWLPDRSAFAGSVSLTNRLVRTMVELADVSVTDAVKMASLTPARIMGAQDTLGSLDVGKRGDVVVFDNGFNVSITIVGGETVFRA